MMELHIHALTSVAVWLNHRGMDELLQHTDVITYPYHAGLSNPVSKRGPWRYRSLT